MTQYNNFLVAVDLSDESAPLIKKAQWLAGLHQATLHIVHVIDYTPSLYASSEIALPIDLDSIDHALLTDVKAELTEVATQFDIDKQHCWLLNGEKAHEIEQLVAKIGCNLIMVGAHDKHGLARLFRSTAGTLLLTLPCDILTVKITD